MNIARPLARHERKVTQACRNYFCRTTLKHSSENIRKADG
ncbi:hypothetical protein OU5_4424 [Pseudomonas mandelii JR-1]|uniref:Uncharacterized protein n=1 Tax=Pseudomonas mandelii JR-1 TaxID=1147786 RepID=A0A024EGM7_9PSED|nr:hypothetical protein OU5_4424 [Pseudomonas mandelii JR-1]